MKSSTILLALASTGSSSIIARSVQSILADIETINGDVQNLTTTINGFTASDFGTVTTITNAEGILDNNIKMATSDAKGTSTVSDSDATSILSAVSSLTPNVLAAVDAFVAKLPAFNSAGIGGVASSLLGTLQVDTNAFAAALVSLAPAAEQAAASSASACINAAFESAKVTSTASSCGGPAAASTSAPAGGSSSVASSTPTGSSTPTSTSASVTVATSPSVTSATPTGGSSSQYSVGGSLGAGLVAVVALVL